MMTMRGGALYERIHRTRPRDPGSAPVLPTRWRDMSLASQLYLYTLAADHKQDAHVFTIQFFRTVHRSFEVAKTSPHLLLAQRLRTYLRNIPWFFVLEVSSSELIHVHGTLDPSGVSHGEIKKALKRAAGDQRKIKTTGEHFFFHCKAVDLQLADWSEQYGGGVGPYGWAKYIAKCAANSQSRLGLGRAPVSVQREIKARAKAAFEEDLAFARSLHRD